MERENIPFWEVVLQADMEERQVTRKQSMAKMLITWQAMEDSSRHIYRHAKERQRPCGRRRH